MGGLFGKAPSPPPPDPAIAEAQNRQEARLAEQERKQQAELAARRRARQIGGQRMLLSSDRQNAEMGITDQTTLGAS